MNQKEKMLSEKELAMFQAVIDLIDENVDVNSMKVSDITGRAGIGKGTAYEYFSSKEEMVAKAIIWAAQQESEKIMEILEEKSTMEEQILAVMEYIRTEMCSQKYNIQLLKILGNSCETKEKLRQEFENSSPVQQNIERVAEKIINQGKKEKKIASGTKDTLNYMAVISGFISYFVFLNKTPAPTDVTPEEMEQFLCRNIIRSLENGF